MLARCCLVVVLAALGGCAYLEHDIGASLDTDAISRIGPGSSYAAVLDELGPPTKVSALPGGMAFLYEHVSLVERQYGLILPGEIGKWIKAVYASADADVEAIVFVFDNHGKLLSADDERWGSDAGAGMSLTLIFSAGSFTDTEQYESSPARALDWGSALTKPLPVTLNARQSLESGQNGIQLTTNSEGIGQHTLELKRD